MTPGARFRSQVCSTEVIVIRPADVELYCGGHPMVGLADTPAPGLTPADGHRDGALLGKRYTTGDGVLEVLVTKAGDGTLGTSSESLLPLQAKQLPSSD
ncbi:hypothetical protein VSH64_10610 [Amycolatopsis rhabdoformis]|uniref:Uncharacterized protein n=1 Tax=Amycolatopsis rhabdoformis TaxID=1448059 RepID=A0ABZ1IEN7_9PSEU|nr:hypothetical protein [Amycolatopsis rhabdoformis]WSE32556.1 hypothetical protein VSH64_10610 [Amycolatopsis rhabdoformis]